MVSLRALLQALGPVVAALPGASTTDVEVDEVVLVGPGDALPGSAAGVLLVCTDPALLTTGDGTAAAYVVKPGALDPGTWAGLTVPVLAADPALPWNQLLHLLTAAVRSTSSSGAIGDLFAIANTVAAMVGGAVAVEDPHRRVLAYSSLPDQPIDDTRRRGILGRQVPELSGNDTIYRQVQRSPGIVRMPAEGDVLPRLAVAVRAGAEVLGSLWVIETTPAGPEAQQALLDAARLTALHLLRARAGTDVERRSRGELLRGLLDGRSAPDVVAGRLGLDPAQECVVLGFGLQTPVGDELDLDAVATLVQVQCGAVRARVSVLAQQCTVYALLPAQDLTRARLLALARLVVERAQAALRVDLVGAVGATVPGLAAVGRSRQDVDAVLRLTAAGTVAAVETVLPQVVLLDLHAHLATSPHLLLPAVLRLLEHDAKQDGMYAQSVLAYLTANADVPVAAAAVNVHPNTFRYRLRRVRELFDLDLEDPDVRLVTWLQLRARA